MAGETGNQSSDLTRDKEPATGYQYSKNEQCELKEYEAALFENMHRYRFAKIYHFLSELAQRQNGSVRVRPNLSLELPRSEVVSVSRVEDRDGSLIYYLIEVNHIGMYGVQSPLPNFFTEELIKYENDEQYEARAFIDIFHQNYYQLLVNIHSIGSVSIKNSASRRNLTGYIFSLMGLDESNFQLQDKGKLTKYYHLFKKKQRSVQGLKVLLESVFNGMHIVIDECVSKKVKIGKDMQLQLGNSNFQLGYHALLGDSISDDVGNILVHVGPIEVDFYQNFMTDLSAWQQLKQTIVNYIDSPLVIEFRFYLDSEQASTATLNGERWSRLGVDTWLYSQDSFGEGNRLLSATQFLAQVETLHVQ